MADVADNLPSPWRRLWQVPLLVLGLALFLWGLRALKAARDQGAPDFSTQVQDIQTLLAAHAAQKALDQIADIREFYPGQREQSTLEMLAGHAFFIAQEAQPVVVRSNYEKVIEHYVKATPYVPAADRPLVERRWGLAALALGEYDAAVQHLEAAARLDRGSTTDLVHQLVEAYLGVKPPAREKALALLEHAARSPAVDEKVWALGRRLELTLHTPELPAALADALAAAGQIKENQPLGGLLTWIGRAQLEQGALDAAEATLKDARSKFLSHTLEDGRAALLLGRIAQARGQYDAARELYQEVITSHAGTGLVLAARLGRAEISALRDAPDELMIADYRYAAREVGRQTDAAHRSELVTATTVGQSLITEYGRYFAQGRYEDAIEFLRLQKLLGAAEDADAAYRWAQAHERLAQEQRDAAAAASDVSARNALLERALGNYGEAGEAYLRHAHLATMDDQLAAQSLWRAGQMFDLAGRSEQAIEVFARFVTERPRDPRVPEGLQTIGLLYESLGMYDQAIGYFQRNIDENPKTPSSYMSTVELARCYMTRGEAGFSKSEAALLSLVQNNTDLKPTANEFRVSLFTLGELYYRTGRWSDAILRLEEALARYPQDAAVPRATFWLADCYRKSAHDIADAIAKNPAIEERDALEQARVDRLGRAGELFGQVVALLDPAPPDAGVGATTGPAPSTQAAAKAALGGLDQQYLRYSYLYRADCGFELGDYLRAVKLYDQAAGRFPSTITAVDAYVQIVNAYLALKEPAQARAAAERARWLLKRVPDDAFGQPPLRLKRAYYEELFRSGPTGS